MQSGCKHHQHGYSGLRTVMHSGFKHHLQVVDYGLWMLSGCKNHQQVVDCHVDNHNFFCDCHVDNFSMRKIIQMFSVFSVFTETHKNKYIVNLYQKRVAWVFF